jgi:two-component system response regulator PilR (NtrC family)
VADINFPSEGIDLDELMNRLEKNLLLKALGETQGRKKKAAELLRISFRSFRYRLEKHGIDAPGDE